MSSIEKRASDFLYRHFEVVALAVLLVISVAIRVSLRHFVSDDAVECLLPWYDQIRSNGGMAALSSQVGNYNLLYQTIIAALTYLPVNALYAYKALSCLFDYLLAAAVGYCTYLCVAERQPQGTKKDGDAILKAGIAASVTLLLPSVFLDSAAWAQCDSIYSFFVVSSLLLTIRGKYPLAYVAFGIACALKLQALFFLPFLLLDYLLERDHSLLLLLVVPAVMLATGIPAMAFGRNPFDVFSIYLWQTNYFQTMTMNYPGFWSLMTPLALTDVYASFKGMAIGVSLAATTSVFLLFLRNGRKASPSQAVLAAFLLTYTFVLFLPGMHERYDFIYLILGIVVAVTNRKTVPAFVALASISLMTYGYALLAPLYGGETNLTAIAVANLAVYVCYLLLATRTIRSEQQLEA